ncbi:MAG: tRNA (cytidine(34)-2'-O)-methyltransferase [Chromatiales bacterium]|jgi:tRNA (cytidine/uridine-2'-O-)-methyltransferase|nr:tRNA (cytidine(34)-2'-O)-methyltransferase [Chromatiales bacterium]
MIQIALFEPEIPPNTGNIIRLCANSGAALHLIEPLGFSMQHKALRRAGLDYHEFASVAVHKNLSDFHASISGSRVFAYSTHAKRRHTDCTFHHGDVLLFGPETRGLPADLMAAPTVHQVVRIPMRAGVRSLNLSNAVAIAAYEAWRQLAFDGASDEKTASPP